MNGSQCHSIVIENDKRYDSYPGVGERKDFTLLSKEEIRDCIKKAGVVGMGGAGFPTHIKLTPKDEDAIQYVIVNGAECEPYLTSDYRMMVECPEKILQGLRVILHLFDYAKGIIAIEDNKPEAILAMKCAVKHEDRMEVRVLRTKYPQGAERQIVYACTGKRLNSSMLPSDVGCVVNNVDTVIAVGRAVCETMPSITRIVTVTGDAVWKPRNFQVRTGTLYSELIEDAGGFRTEPEKIIAGGAMMGVALYTTLVPVTKISSALLCLSEDEVSANEPTACIRCGRCLTVCPCKLVPQKMAECVGRGDKEGFIDLHGMECYECGACTYECPSKRRLTQGFVTMRREIIAERRKGDGR